jgi:hypothetical protein
MCAICLAFLYVVCSMFTCCCCCCRCWLPLLLLHGLQSGIVMQNYEGRMEASWAYAELERVRNIRPGFRWVQGFGRGRGAL